MLVMTAFDRVCTPVIPDFELPMLILLPQHDRHDQGHSGFAYVKPSPVQLRVEAHSQPVRDAAALVDNDLPQVDMAANLHVREQKRILDNAVLCDGDV